MGSLSLIRQRVATLRAETAHHSRLCLGQLTTILAEDSFLFIYLFFVAANIVFAPLPFSSWIFGWPLMVAAWQELRGASHVLLPEWLGRRTIKPADILRCLDWIDRELNRIEPWLTTTASPSPRLERIVPSLCFCLCFVLMLPVPFLNIPPLIGMALLQLGHHTGHAKLIIAGIGMSILTLLGLVAFGLGMAGLASL